MEPKAPPCTHSGSPAREVPRAAEGRSSLRCAWARIILIAIPLVAAGGCASGPQTKTVVEDSFSIESIAGTSRQSIGYVAIEDHGEAHRLVQPVEVQACDGHRLKYRRVERKTKKGGRRVEEVPVFETIDPLRGVYIRRLVIRNATGHVLRLNRMDAVLVDAAGNDNELVTKSRLRRRLRAERPCRSTRGLVASLRGLKVLGADIRMRPGRVAELYAVFSGVDERIIGDWTMELHEVPVVFDAAGRTVRLATFEFPLVSKGYRTTRVLRKEKLFDPWKEIHRTTEEILPGR